MNRRTLLTGAILFVAAPAIVRASSLMAVKPVPVARPELIFESLSPEPGPDHERRMAELIAERNRRTLARVAEIEAEYRAQGKPLPSWWDAAKECYS